MTEIIVLAFVSMLAKFLEDCRKISLSSDKKRRLKNFHGVYEAVNFHLGISLSVLSVMSSKRPDLSTFGCFGVFLMAGIVSKSVFSNHRPDELYLRDHDACFGLIVPNGFAAASVLAALMLTSPWYIEHAFPTSAILFVALFAFLLGMLFSIGGTHLCVGMFCVNHDPKSQLRLHSIGLIDALLSESKKRPLTETEHRNLESTLMAFFMTATSKRTAAKTLARIRGLTTVFSKDFLAESQSVIEDRFPAKGQ